MSEAQVLIVDRMIVRPGRAREFLALYMDRYAPGARARGMAFESVQISPPMWLAEQSNTLTITWSVKGAGAWWYMSSIGRGDQAVADWWAEADEWVVERDRSFSASPEDVERLSHV